MILYSDRDDHYSQRVRIVLAEKDITAEIKESKPEETPEDILSISPYHKLPILVDRDLATKYPEVEMSCKALCPRAIITIRDDVTIPNKLLYNNNVWSLASPNDLYEYNLLQEHC